MEVKKIKTKKLIESSDNYRPKDLNEFIWQEDIKKTLSAAIKSAIKRDSTLWHILLTWQSWYGKTTLSNIIAHQLWVSIRLITWYAITKPSEIISILNSLENWDILFIDEIHRIKPNIEEVLYVAMEDYAVDMIMPEWWNVRIPLNNFCLIWATTKSENLSQPLKNRFVYKMHFSAYNNEEKIKIITRYLKINWIKFDSIILKMISDYVIDTPREISNFAIKLRDYLISMWAKENKLFLDFEIWEEFKDWAKLSEWWLWMLHLKYLEILEENLWWPLGLKTISLKLWINEKAVEEDIEPLLLQLWKIEKTSKGRILKES